MVPSLQIHDKISSSAFKALMNIWDFATTKDSKKFLSVLGGHLTPTKIPCKEEEGYYYSSLLNGRDLKAISRHK